MKSLVFNRKSLLFSTLLASAFGLNAQITSTHTDEKYGYTTVVYKDKAATDKDVLAALDNSIGMGDVVRVTVAPPKPAAVPVIDKAKGEDVWLKPATVPAINLTAATAAVPDQAVRKSAPAVATRSVALAAVAVGPAAVTPKPVAKKVENAPKPVVTPEKKQAEAPVVAAAPVALKTKTIGTAKNAHNANKSLKKGGKKSGGAYKMKSRKKGKQRYSCPKF